MESEYKRHASTQLLPPLTNTSRRNKSPFEVFPEELWQTILLDHVDSASNLQTIYAALPEFATVFRKQITTVQYTRNSSHVCNYQPTLEYPQVPRNLINMEWCQAVYQFLQIRQSPSVFERFLPVTHLLSCKTLRTVQEVSKFHQSLKANPINSTGKFPALNLAMALGTSDWQEYLGACINLLSKFGEKVRKITLILTNVNQNIYAFVTGFATFLSSLPNAQSLAIGLVESKADLKDKVHMCTTFPPLTHLQELQILSSGDSQIFLLQYFLNGGYFGKGGIKTLLLQHFDPVPDRWSMNVVLKYKLDTQKTFPKNLANFREMLTTQKIETAILTPTYNCRILYLFQWLSEERHKMEELILDKRSKGLMIVTESIPVRKLPTVKYVKVTDGLDTQFEFLVALPNLEYLHVVRMPEKTWDRCERKGQVGSYHSTSKLIRSYLYLEQIPKRNNIWKIFPSLKMFVVEDVGNPTKYFVREYGNTPVVFQNTIEIVDVE